VSGHLYLTFAPLWERFRRGEGALLAVSAAVVWLRGPLTRTGAAQLALSFLVLATLYSLNDLCDARADGRNPKKNPRLVASFVAHADGFGLCLGAVQVGLALLAYALLGGTAALVVVALLALNVLYSVRLKGVPFVDVVAVGAWGGLYAAIASPPARLCVLVGVMTAIAHVFQVLEDRDVDAENGINTTAVLSLPATTLVLALLCATLASLLARELGWGWAATGLIPLALHLGFRPGAPAWLGSRGCFGLMLVAVLGAF